MKNETCKLYSGVFWIFLPNIIKLDPYHFELHCFKVKPFLDTVYVISKAVFTANHLTDTDKENSTGKYTNQIQLKKANNAKYRKLPWCSCLLRQSARKQDGLILQCSRSHTGLIWCDWCDILVELLPMTWDLPLHQMTAKINPNLSNWKNFVQDTQKTTQLIN